MRGENHVVLVGEIGDLVSFSFQANKNLTTGEGGALAFHQEAWETRLKALRFHGIENLIYSGFATDMCVLRAPGGVEPMAPYGYRIFLMRDATVGVVLDAAERSFS